MSRRRFHQLISLIITFILVVYLISKYSEFFLLLGLAIVGFIVYFTVSSRKEKSKEDKPARETFYDTLKKNARKDD